MYCDLTFKSLGYPTFGKERLVGLCDVLLTKNQNEA